MSSLLYVPFATNPATNHLTCSDCLTRRVPQPRQDCGQNAAFSAEPHHLRQPEWHHPTAIASLQQDEAITTQQHIISLLSFPSPAGYPEGQLHR
jgi:hypothetical protein